LGKSVADVLLTPTRIYARLVSALMRDERLRPFVTGIAHITGGGLADNTGRIVPQGLQAVIDRSTWKTPGVFDWVRRLGDIDREEMYRVFNMGIGLVLVVRPQAVEAALELVRGLQWEGRIIGEIRTGEESAIYAS